MRKINIRAFTLIELLVVIAIIGILSALIVVGMSSTTQKATIAKAQVFSNSLRNSLMGNLVSEWRLDGNANDSWSGGNNGTWYGAGGGSNTTANYRPAAECVSGQCLNFDGTDDYVDCGDSNSLKIVTSLTLTVWIKTTATNKYIIGKSMWTNDHGYYVYIDGSQKARMSIDDGVNPRMFAQSLSSVGDNNWHYITGTFIPSTNVKIYIDGNIEKTESVGVPVQPADVLTFRIGFDPNGQAGTYFAGLMDDIRVYNAAVPTSQIQQNYFVGLNKLFAKNQITQSDYHSRIANLTNNYAKE